MPEIATLKTPFLQMINGVLRKLLVETIAEQVKLADGTTVQATITNLKNAVSQQTVSYVVPDIAGRNALDVSTLHVGDQAWVIDATADSTVTLGAAKYILQSLTPGANEGDPATPVWVKTAEAESLDVTIDWSMIQNKPTNSVANIDAAVDATIGLSGHALSVDSTTGNLKLDNADVGRVYAASVSLTEEDAGFAAAVSALNLPEGAILTSTAADTPTEPAQQGGGD